jgi:Uma2 family endonuclease
MVQAARIKQRITAQEYAEMYPETTQSMELIDGEVMTPPAPFDIHGEIVYKLMLRIGIVVITQDLGTMRTAPNDVYFDDYNVVQPDVFYIAKENSHCRREADGYLHGAPDLCVEVLSSSTARRDRDSKFKLYQKHGVREYWLVDPDAQFIEVYVLMDGAFKQAGIYGKGESFTSSVLPQLSLKLDEVFPDSPA